MKARVCFEFELEPEAPDREASRDSYDRAASAAEEAIEHHLIGNGFLPDDLSLDCWSIGSEVIDPSEGDDHG
ncbi:MAG TPA: hypothetical protein VJ770_22845 [Stellaceae bacterium]|nr:hypothetical protein [Stellaceae bacterium]